MNDSTAERDPIDLLADSFVGRLRAGQRPSIAEYAARYPALAGELQELLPASSSWNKMHLSTRPATD